MLVPRTCLITLILLFLAGFSFGQGGELRKKHFNLKGDVALDGFDPTSYFDEDPVKGNAKLQLLYKGVIYQFASQTNLNKFKSTPDKFEPAYGGWCAFAMGNTGEKVKIDPETYLLLDGKLYLFYNFWGNNTLTDWKKNQTKLKEEADRHWKATLQ